MILGRTKSYLHLWEKMKVVMASMTVIVTLLSLGRTGKARKCRYDYTLLRPEMAIMATRGLLLGECFEPSRPSPSRILKHLKKGFQRCGAMLRMFLSSMSKPLPAPKNYLLSKRPQALKIRRHGRPPIADQPAKNLDGELGRVGGEGSNAENPGIPMMNFQMKWVRVVPTDRLLLEQEKTRRP